MDNPFQLHWAKGWSFRIVLLGGYTTIEAYGFGVCLRTSLMPGENPKSTADKMVQREDRNRKAIHNAWKRDKIYISKNDLTESSKETLLTLN
tara:strand:- start:139 stop:414 length:276 start_codon:yes stop_codon:yes gene_type:complete